mmetsp:Transcript_4641/g.7962  ORF Transcript_4641/g.7962 Transcript_4641/m.7962 type:complete len:200 (+) Transcript_4641:163-762(+)
MRVPPKGQFSVGPVTSNYSVNTEVAAPLNTQIPTLPRHSPDLTSLKGHPVLIARKATAIMHVTTFNRARAPPPPFPPLPPPPFPPIVLGLRVRPRTTDHLLKHNRIKRTVVERCHNNAVTRKRGAAIAPHNSANNLLLPPKVSPPNSKLPSMQENVPLCVLNRNLPTPLHTTMTTVMSTLEALWIAENLHVCPRSISKT